MMRDTPLDGALAAVNGWLRDPERELFPFDAVLHEIQTSGKHFLPGRLAAELDRARAACRDGAPLLRAFLDCALDKRDGRYSYRSYLCLPLLEDLLDAPRPRGASTELVGLLVADALRYELAADRDGPATLPRGRPDATVRHKRLRYGLRLLNGYAPAGAEALDVDRLSHADGPDLPELEKVLDSPAAQADPVVAQRLALSMQPVHVLHDEYLFLRVLQSYETVFAALVGSARQARDLLRRGRPEGAVAALTEAAGQLDRTGLLFSLLATMDIGGFRRFRRYTEGSSAIQSARYKRFECLCGRPREDRWSSPAFGSVPSVAEQTAADPDTISLAYLAARESKAFTAAQWSALDTALARLEHSHQHWKATHHSLAARMIGEATGSGYTSGVPYLDDCLGNRLFWRLGERYLPVSREPDHRP
ncbi:tryptophan 2,3-dioxygenase [Kitasatospora sp. HPMI-4]|uniref:tryptophan 2,3-dioxygenase n=1 Tax=Kitasatospora sp. HPMI-4 TaxID=3448443 RepID=UPI003F1B3635